MVMDSQHEVPAQAASTSRVYSSVSKPVLSREWALLWAQERPELFHLMLNSLLSIDGCESESSEALDCGLAFSKSFPSVLPLA